MKIAPAQLRTALVDDQGRITPKWVQWLQELTDSKMREVKDAGISPVPPVMRIGEMIVFKATGVGKVYLVYYDGENRYYWESSGTD